MATFRELINRVLIAVGQADDQVDDTATELTDAYHIKVAEWVNDVLEEFEDSAQWRVLRQRETATISANGISVALTNSNERSRVFRVSNEHTGELVPLVFDVTNPDSQQRLIEMDFAQLLWMDQNNSNNVDSTTGPRYFALSQTAAGQDIYVWPRTSQDVDIEIDMIIPQSRFDYTSDTDLDTSVLVANMPVVYGAVWWAMSDRGEEFGTNTDKAEQRYNNMVAGAVAAENAAQGFDELVPT
jgi:hypothetical protein